MKHSDQVDQALRFWKAVAKIILIGLAIVVACFLLFGCQKATIQETETDAICQTGIAI